MPKTAQAGGLDQRAAALADLLGDQHRTESFHLLIVHLLAYCAFGALLLAVGLCIKAAFHTGRHHRQSFACAIAVVFVRGSGSNEREKEREELD